MVLPEVRYHQPINYHVVHLPHPLLAAPLSSSSYICFFYSGTRFSPTTKNKHKPLLNIPQPRTPHKIILKKPNKNFSTVLHTMCHSNEIMFTGAERTRIKKTTKTMMSRRASGREGGLFRFVTGFQDSHVSKL